MGLSTFLIQRKVHLALIVLAHTQINWGYTELEVCEMLTYVYDQRNTLIFDFLKRPDNNYIRTVVICVSKTNYSIETQYTRIVYIWENIRKKKNLSLQSNLLKVFKVPSVM